MVLADLAKHLPRKGWLAFSPTSGDSLIRSIFANSSNPSATGLIEKLLFLIIGGELGNDPTNLEEKLNSIFQLPERRNSGRKAVAQNLYPLAN